MKFSSINVKLQKSLVFNLVTIMCNRILMIFTVVGTRPRLEPSNTEERDREDLDFRLMHPFLTVTREAKAREIITPCKRVQVSETLQECPRGSICGTWNWSAWWGWVVKRRNSCATLLLMRNDASTHCHGTCDDSLISHSHLHTQNKIMPALLFASCCISMTFWPNPFFAFGFWPWPIWNYYIALQVVFNNTH